MSALAWVQVGLNLTFWPMVVLWFGSRRYRAGIERGIRMACAVRVAQIFQQADVIAATSKTEDRRPN